MNRMSQRRNRVISHRLDLSLGERSLQLKEWRALSYRCCLDYISCLLFSRRETGLGVHPLGFTILSTNIKTVLSAWNPRRGVKDSRYSNRVSWSQLDGLNTVGLAEVTPYDLITWGKVSRRRLRLYLILIETSLPKEDSREVVEMKVNCCLCNKYNWSRSIIFLLFGMKQIQDHGQQLPLLFFSEHR